MITGSMNYNRAWLRFPRVAGLFLHAERPDAVVEAVRNVLDQVRAERQRQ